jgi:preprotein translocase subunit YajC
VKVEDDQLTIDLGNAQKVKVVRSMIADVRNRAVPANDTKKK